MVGPRPGGEDDASPNKTMFKQGLRKTPQQPQKIHWPNFLRLFAELDLKPMIATMEQLEESPVLPLSYVGSASSVIPRYQSVLFQLSCSLTVDMLGGEACCQLGR